MEHAVLRLLLAALETALVLALPVIAAVALVGIGVGIAQTIIQVQDQNVSFLPKLLVIALLIFVFGAPGLALLAQLFKAVAIGALRMVGH